MIITTGTTITTVTTIIMIINIIIGKHSGATAAGGIAHSVVRPWQAACNQALHRHRGAGHVGVRARASGIARGLGTDSEPQSMSRWDVSGGGMI
jgi:hypothetical protein